MEKKLWNYLYSVLLSIILLLLIGIFLQLNNKSGYKIKNDSIINKNGNTKESVAQTKEQSTSDNYAFFYHNIIEQKSKEPSLFNKFVINRNKEDVKAKIAIIIDDMGHQKNIAEQLMELGYPVAISVLPFLQHSQEVAEMAKEKGFTVLLHLPMQPQNSDTDPGKGAIFTTMNEQEIRAKIVANLQNVPNIVGVNNHMGSKATEDDRIMEIVLTELKERNLFFVDSMTTPHSVGYKLSKEMGLKTAQRNVFLDNEQDVNYIRNQVVILKDLALDSGSAIAIGHPYCNTVSVLKEMDSILGREGVEIVRIEDLLE